MLKAEQVLKVLKKYGFYSLNRAPYLYQNGNELGVYFVWPNKHYGNLERVLCFEDEKTLEEEVYKYWWYITNKDKVTLEIEFDNYEIVSPKVTYKHKETVLTKELMKNFYENKNEFVDQKEVIKKRQLMRTANILIAILKEKFKLQTNTYFKVEEMSEELKALTNTYYQRLKEYNKDTGEVPSTCELLVTEEDESDALVETLNQELQAIDTIEDLRTYINTLFTYLSELEANDVHLQNVYLLKRYPYEIVDMKKKIALLEEAIKTKKKRFKSKADVMALLLAIDNQSECKKMIGIDVYVEREKSQILQKYQNRESIDENVLGDYLVNFEKLDIPVPDMIQSTLVEEFSNEEMYQSLESAYQKLSDKEKSACFVAASYLKDCLNILIAKNAQYDATIHDVISKLILSNQMDLFNDAFVTLDNYINTKIRVKYFSVLNINSFESFLESLIEVIRILDKINISLDKSFSGYYNNKEKGIIPLHLKNIYNYNNNKFSYIVTVLPKIPLYYSPVSIVKVVDILENVELVERDNEMIFLLKNKISIKTQQEKVMVVKYEKENLIKRKDYNLVSSVKEKNRCIYYVDMLYNKETEA